MPRAQNDGQGVADDGAADEQGGEVAIGTGGEVADDTGTNTTDDASSSAGGASADEPEQAPDQSGAHATGGAPADPEPEATPADGGSPSTPKKGCEDVCDTLAQCKSEPIPECYERCSSSEWIEPHGLHCLALRVYWINEEGCDTMLKTYAAFQQDDDCTGSLELDP